MTAVPNRLSTVSTTNVNPATIKNKNSDNIAAIPLIHFTIGFHFFDYGGAFFILLQILPISKHKILYCGNPLDFYQI